MTARVVYYGDERTSPHKCAMPKGNPPEGTVVFCDDCGRYWRLDHYKVVWPSGVKTVGTFTMSTPEETRPIWNELGMFGTWWYVWRMRGVQTDERRSG